MSLGPARADAADDAREEVTIVQHGGERAHADVSALALKHGVVFLGGGEAWYSDGTRLCFLTSELERIFLFFKSNFSKNHVKIFVAKYH